ncbi:MAG: SDR family NAD(P)-dependent oxidoreductase [Rhodoblastus sp.]|nr:MAG: SDR family NAD(P)-dependent oxidoreductase [Rhodoblastus sp.]
MARLENRIALVTGASRGIGRAIALELAKNGAHVLAMARTQGALEELDDDIRAMGRECTLIPCDVTDYEAIERLAGAIHHRWGKLDILVANAGVLGSISPLAHIDPKEWDKVLAVNVTANWRLIRALDPLLRTSDAGRLVMLSSAAGNRAEMRAYWGPYAISKAALDAMARTYAAETKNVTNVRVTSINPGPLRTKMRAAAMTNEDPMTLKTPEDFAPSVVRFCAPDWTESGKVYDFPTDKVLSFQGPA